MTSTSRVLYDTIVVGGGPAGSTAARECAAKGLSVALLDRAEFPRDKPCGGGVTKKARDCLPFDLAPVTERTVFNVSFTDRRFNSVERTSDQALVYMTQRVKLDVFLLERAQNAGVHIYEGVRVNWVDQQDDCVSVGTTSGVYRGRTLVAADGANGKTAQLAGLEPRFTLQIAIEGNISPSDQFPRQWENTIGLDLARTAGGYGWIFPKGDHLNIGICGWQQIGPQLRDALAKQVRLYGLDPDELWGVKGHHIPIRKADSPLAKGRVIIVGDAAGLVDPLTAEGIHSAIWSGNVGARHLERFLSGEAKDLSGYAEDVNRQLAPELAVAQILHDNCHSFPALVFAVERRRPFLWHNARRTIVGETTYAEITKTNKIFSAYINTVSKMARTIGPL